MKNISTGEPSTLGTYRNIALILSGSKDSKAVQFFDKKIEQSPNAENEIVIADETQMMVLIAELVFNQPPRNIGTELKEKL